MKTAMAIIGGMAAACGLGYVVYRYTKGGHSLKQDANKVTGGLKSQYEAGKSYVKNLFTKPATEKNQSGPEAAAGAAA